MKKFDVGEFVDIDGPEGSNYVKDKSKGVEVVGELKSPEGSCAIVDVGGKYGLIAVDWDKLKEL